MWEDPIVNEIREIRKGLESKFDFDAKLIFQDIRMRQISSGAKFTDRGKNIAERLLHSDIKPNAYIPAGESFVESITS